MFKQGCREYQEGIGKMSMSVGIIDELEAPSATDNLDINIHSEAPIDFIANSNTPITVGIHGELDSGKTSLINSIRHAFEDCIVFLIVFYMSVAWLPNEMTVQYAPVEVEMSTFGFSQIGGSSDPVGGSSGSGAPPPIDL